MAASNPKLTAALLSLGLMLPGAHALGAPAATAGPINLDAQSSELDLKTNNVYFRKVRIAQGANSVTADQGQATREALGGNFDNSLWVFRGNVKITMQGGLLTADEAQVDFAKKLLSKAVAHGKPAEFEQRLEKTEDRARPCRRHRLRRGQGHRPADQERLAQRWPERSARRVAQVQRGCPEHHRRC